MSRFRLFGRDEPVLARAESDQGPVEGTRAALRLPGRSLPWEEVHAASWDDDSGVLTVTETGAWGEPRAVHVLRLEDPTRLLQLVRERVSATMVLQRPVELPGGRARILARRATVGERTVRWYVDYDPGIDPDDPVVVDRVRTALGAAQEELGGA